MATPSIQSFGNNLVVGRTSYRFNGTFTDENKLINLFGYDNVKGDNYMGIFTTFNQFSPINVPLLKRAILEKNIIYTEGNVGNLSFQTPFRLEGMTVKSDLTADVEKPGVDKTIFEIHVGDGGLDSVLQIGDRITADYYNGQNLIVIEVKQRKGEGYVYAVQLITEDKEEFFNKTQLTPGTQFFKVGHSTGEYGEYGSGVWQGFGLMDLYHRLGGRRMMEYTMTGDAQRAQINGKFGNTELVLSHLDKYGDLTDPIHGGVLVVGEKGADGKIKKDKMSWMPFIEVMLFNELFRLEERDLTFAQGGTFTGARNKTEVVGQGIYQQMKKGNWETLPRYTRNGLISVFNKVFRNRTDLPDTERFLKLEGGRGAVQEIQKIFQQEFISTATQGSFLLDAQRIGVVSGDPMNLKVGYKVGQVFISGVGWLSVEHNPAFDSYDSRTMNEPEIGGLPKRSFTSCIWDLMDGNSTNAAQVGSGVEFAQGRDNGANVYLVKNKQFPGIKKGLINGRTSPHPIQNGGWNIYNGRFDGATMLLESQSNIFLKDPTRSLLLELA